MDLLVHFDQNTWDAPAFSGEPAENFSDFGFFNDHGLCSNSLLNTKSVHNGADDIASLEAELQRQRTERERADLFSVVPHSDFNPSPTKRKRQLFDGMNVFTPLEEFEQTFYSNGVKRRRFDDKIIAPDPVTMEDEKEELSKTIDDIDDDCDSEEDDNDNLSDEQDDELQEEEEDSEFDLLDDDELIDLITSEVPTDMLPGLIDILSEEPQYRSLRQDFCITGELEFDIKDLRPAALIKLKKYVQRCCWHPPVTAEDLTARLQALQKQERELKRRAREEKMENEEEVDILSRSPTEVVVPFMSAGAVTFAPKPCGSAVSPIKVSTPAPKIPATPIANVTKRVSPKSKRPVPVAIPYTVSPQANRSKNVRSDVELYNLFDQKKRNVKKARQRKRNRTPLAKESPKPRKLVRIPTPKSTPKAKPKTQPTKTKTKTKTKKAKTKAKSKGKTKKAKTKTVTIEMATDEPSNCAVRRSQRKRAQMILDAEELLKNQAITSKLAEHRSNPKTPKRKKRRARKQKKIALLSTAAEDTTMYYEMHYSPSKPRKKPNGIFFQKEEVVRGHVSGGEDEDELDIC
eukprot:TRINITY_DN3614_c0_g1_i1.p1 TRINITY_DN3614_c0_g1~~TRINITY_DN3614_c0_g1_i1.p1  ORF type:complete len:574 (+),score=140.19 TRINITY_DN3614_c0_g1_i1:58-1779(+)